MGEQKPLFVIHSLDKVNKTLLIEINQRVVDDLLEGLNYLVNKAETSHGLEKELPRYKLYRDTLTNKSNELHNG